MHINIAIPDELKAALDRKAQLMSELAGVKITYADLIRGMCNQAVGSGDVSPGAAWARHYIDASSPFALAFPQSVNVEAGNLEIKGATPGGATIKLDGREIVCKSIQLAGDASGAWVARLEVVLEESSND